MMAVSDFSGYVEDREEERGLLGLEKYCFEKESITKNHIHGLMDTMLPSNPFTVTRK